MGLQFSLMGTVATILKWIVRVENGGLLNIAFEKVATTTTGETEFDVSKDLMGKTIDFAKQALMLKEIPLPILKEIPESLGGGKPGVDDAHSHPNREPLLFFITIGVFLAVVLLQFVSCCCLECGIKKVFTFLYGLTRLVDILKDQLILSLSVKEE